MNNGEIKNAQVIKTKTSMKLKKLSIRKESSITTEANNSPPKIFEKKDFSSVEIEEVDSPLKIVGSILKIKIFEKSTERNIVVKSRINKNINIHNA